MGQIEEVVLYKSFEIEVVVYPSLKLIEIKANGLVPSTIYQESINIAVDEAIRGNLLYWLVNNEISGIISTEDQIWTNEVIAPKIVTETKISKMAFIQPEDIYSIIILEDLMNNAKEVFPFEMMFFDKRDDAIQWFIDPLG